MEPVPCDQAWLVIGIAAVLSGLVMQMTSGYLCMTSNEYLECQKYRKIGNVVKERVKNNMLLQVESWCHWDGV
jgi:hypothetical protein